MGGIAIEAPAAELLAGRYGLVAGLVDGEGVPHATRAWGMTVLDERPLRFRLVLPLDDGLLLRLGEVVGPIAVTATEPLTLRSVQFKGQAGPIEPATAEDRATVARFCDSFFSALIEIDGFERSCLERVVPADFLVCTVVVDELYDQTPGPGAGAAIGGGTP
jgi:hypothetical protein